MILFPHFVWVICFGGTFSCFKKSLSSSTAFFVSVFSLELFLYEYKLILHFSFENWPKLKTRIQVEVGKKYKKALHFQIFCHKNENITKQKAPMWIALTLVTLSEVSVSFSKL